MNIYERQPRVNPVDSLEYRKHVNKASIYYDKPQSRKCKHIVNGWSYDRKAHDLTTFSLRKMSVSHAYSGTRYLVNNVLMKEDKFTKLVRQGNVKFTSVRHIGMSKEYQCRDLYIVE
mgnify:CR=1 FL=1